MLSTAILPRARFFSNLSFYLLCCLVAQSCMTLREPMDCSTPGFPVLHYFPEFAQIHVYWVSDAIQPSHCLPPSSLAFSVYQHQGLFQWLSSLLHMAKALELQLQHQSFQWIFSYSVWISFRLTGLISLQSKGLSRSLQTTVQKHQFFSVQLSLWIQLSHPYMTTGEIIALTR